MGIQWFVFRQEAFPMTSDELYDGVTRRSILKTGAATAGAVTIGAAGAAAHHDEDHENGGKQGGRAQVEGEPRRNVPFRLSSTPESATMLNASCMSAESAQQAYLGYGIRYCDSDGDENEDDDTMYVIPDEARLNEDQVYEFRSVQLCKEPGDGYDSEDIHKVAFSPANHECPE